MQNEFQNPTLIGSAPRLTIPAPVTVHFEQTERLVVKKLLAAAAVLALPISVNAADLPRKAPHAPVAAAAATWTGFYVGGVAGMGMHTSDLGDPDESWTYNGATMKDTAVNIGGTVGYNWQYRSVVFGVEGDWSWTNFSKDGVSYDPGYATINSKWNWFATARARIGWAVDNLLLYGTGGAAFVKTKHEAQWNYSPYMCGENGGYSSCTSSTQTGLAIGAGAEVMLAAHLSAKLEYLYISLPSVNSTNSYYYGGASWNDSAQIVRAGLNYHF
jgi:outer membrane immunogenic protein